MILTIIICAAVGFFLVSKTKYFGIGKMDTCFGALMGGIVGIVFIAPLIGSFCPHEYQCEQIELEVIKDNFGIQGNFFLGSGSIDTKQYYVFYQKLDGGGFWIDKIEAKKATVYEEERDDAMIKKCIPKITGIGKYFGSIMVHKSISEIEKYEIFVPKGTIERDCEFDLE